MSKNGEQDFNIIDLLPELSDLAMKLGADATLAQDIVQETFLTAIEQNLTCKTDLIRICSETVKRTKADRRKEPGTAMNIFQTGRSFECKPHQIERVRSLSDPDENDPYDKAIRLAKAAEKKYKGKFLSFVSAKLLVKNLQFSGRKAYEQFVRHQRILGLPVCPNAVYTDEWSGWSDYLGHSRYSYENLRKYVKETLLPQSIKSKRAYRAFPHPPGVPNNPNRVYKEWRGWDELFGVRRRNSNKEKATILPYAKAKAFVRTHLVPKGIDSLHKWEIHIHQIPEFLPRNLCSFYKGKGWEGASAFFGVKRGAIWWPYDKSRKWVHKNLAGSGIDSYKTWNAYVRGKLRKSRGKILPQLPKTIPKTPHLVYKENGWRTWRHFLNTTNVSIKERMVGTAWSFERAKSWIERNLEGKVRNHTDWQRYVLGLIPSLPERPYNLLSCPKEYYHRTGEWKGWKDFLSPASVPLAGVKRRVVSKRYLSYNQAKRFVEKHLKPKGIDTYRKYIYCKDLPPFLPASPSAYYSYRNRGWKGCTDFMGKTNNPNS